MTDKPREIGVIQFPYRGKPGEMPPPPGKPKAELRRELWETAVEVGSLVRKETGICCRPLAEVILDTYHRLCELEDKPRAETLSKLVVQAMEKKGEEDGTSALSEPDHLAQGDAEGPSVGPGEKA